MSRNPFLNALAAVGYVVVISSSMFYGSKLFPAEDSVIMPIGMLSLFVFSTAVMGYLFLLQPLQLFFEGEKVQAVSLFFKTTLYFALIAFTVVLGWIVVV